MSSNIGLKRHGVVATVLSFSLVVLFFFGTPRAWASEVYPEVSCLGEFNPTAPANDPTRVVQFDFFKIQESLGEVIAVTRGTTEHVPVTRGLDFKRELNSSTQALTYSGYMYGGRLTLLNLKAQLPEDENEPFQKVSLELKLDESAKPFLIPAKCYYLDERRTR